LIQREIYEFGPYSLDCAEMILRRNGSVVPLQPRALQMLLVLVKRRGDVVSKQELMNSIWPDSFVEEGNLAQNVFLLRRELGKAPAGEDYIQTLPKRGYRMNVPVISLTSEMVNGGVVSGSVVTDVAAPESGLIAHTESVAKPGGHNWLIAAWPVLAIFVVAVAGVGIWRDEWAQPKVSGYVQITHDGAMKRGTSMQVGGPDATLFTDGSRIYLTEGSSDSAFLAEVSATGGETARVTVPFQSPELMDISKGRSELLVGGGEETAAEPPLWVIPVPGGVAHRLQDVFAWDASWSPDGREMVFVKDLDLYRAKSDGSDARLLTELPGRGWQPRWSPDAQRLRLTIFDVQSSIHSIWELSSDGTGLRPLIPGWNGGDKSGGGPADGPIDVCCGNWTPDGRYFVFQATRGGRSEIWSIHRRLGLLGKLFPSLEAPVQVTNGQLSSQAPVFSPDGRKLFVLGQQLRGELERFDAHVGEFVPYLGGISADFVDFSRDGQWVTYVAYPEQTLWRSRVDGSERLQLTFAPMQGMVPRWSPDGSQILFYGVGGGKEQRDYLISADGGAAKPASTGKGGEMNASWSPDGHSIFYSDFPFFSKEPGKVAIHLLDLRTQKVETLPGSQGYFSPSASPDGKYVAALTLDGQRLELFDFKTRTWTDLAKGWGLMKWSRDGQYLYYLRYGMEAAVMRLRLGDRRVEEVASLKGIRQAGHLAGLELALTPDGDPMVLRDVGTQEVYSLDWKP